MDALVALGKVALAVAAGVPLVMYLLQDQLIFFPQPMGEAQRAQIEKRLPPSVESVFIDAADGTRLHAWHVKGARGTPLVLYFGGNAEQVSWMLQEATTRVPGASWLLVDYRGYGSSQGKPSQQALVADALAWYDRVAKDHGDVAVFGRSLGSGVAVQLAAQRPVAAAILVTPFDSLTRVAATHYPWLPVSLLLRHRLDSAAVAPHLSIPLLCLAATRDEVIPIAHARRLFDAWAGPKMWVELAGAGHNSTDGAPEFWPRIRAFLEQKEGRKPG